MVLVSTVLKEMVELGVSPRLGSLAGLLSQQQQSTLRRLIAFLDNSLSDFGHLPFCLKQLYI